MFVTISATSSVRVKTCHPSCWRVSLEIRALCGQGSKGSDMTWLWVLSVPSTTGITVHIALLAGGGGKIIIISNMIDELKHCFLKKVFLYRSFQCPNHARRTRSLRLHNYREHNYFPASLSLSLEGQTASSDKCVILTFSNSLIMKSCTLASGYHLYCRRRRFSVMCPSTRFTHTHIWNILCDHTE